MQWKDHPPTETLWMTAQAFHDSYPLFQLEDELFSGEEVLWTLFSVRSISVAARATAQVRFRPKPMRNEVLGITYMFWNRSSVPCGSTAIRKALIL